MCRHLATVRGPLFEKHPPPPLKNKQTKRTRSCCIVQNVLNFCLLASETLGLRVRISSPGIAGVHPKPWDCGYESQARFSAYSLLCELQPNLCFSQEFRRRVGLCSFQNQGEMKMLYFDPFVFFLFFFFFENSNHQRGTG